MKSFSMYGKTQESRLTEIIPLMCTSAIWGQHPAFLHPECPRCTVGGSCGVCWLDGCSILCYWYGRWHSLSATMTVLTLKEGPLWGLRLLNLWGVPVTPQWGRRVTPALVVISFCMIPFALGFPVAPLFYISLLLPELWPWSLQCGAKARQIATFLSILSLQSAPGLPAKWKQTWAEPGPPKLLTPISGQAGDLKEGHMVILWFISNGIRLQPWRGKKKHTEEWFLHCEVLWVPLEGFLRLMGESLGFLFPGGWKDRCGGSLSALDRLSGAQAMIGIVLPCWSLLLTSPFPWWLCYQVLCHLLLKRLRLMGKCLRWTSRNCLAPTLRTASH